MPLLNEPFTFNYFGHIITARSQGPINIPPLSQVTSVHVVPLTVNGHIVAVKVSNRGWDIPGGHIDEGELSPQEALRREAREEANLSLLEPIVIDVLILECDTLDLSAKPYMIIYTAEVSELSAFVPNNETSERSFMSKEEFVARYFGNKEYARVMIDSSIRAMYPNALMQSAAGQRGVNHSAQGEWHTSKAAKRTGMAIIVLPIVVVVLLFSFPLLHMLEVKRRLHSVPLTLSNQYVSSGGNGLTTDRTNVSFTIDKSYSSSLEAKNDIVEKLEKAGITGLQSEDQPSSVFAKNDGSLDSEYITEIHMTFFPKGRAYSELKFVLAKPILLGIAPDDERCAEYVCEDVPKNSEFTKKIVNERAVRSVSVHTLVKY